MHDVNTTKEEPGTGLKRDLKARHLTMIAIGGAIGTGLFVASGATVAQAGPGGALVAYAVIGMMVFFVMTSLGEMAAFMPVSGSFSTYGTEFVSPAMGFALGWNYWYNWAVTIAVELTASSIVMAYWFPSVPGTVWSGIFLAIIFFLNFFSVKGFGEGEYWFSMVKVATVIIFIIVGLLMIFGILTDRGADAGWATFTMGDAPFAGGLPAIIGVAMIAGFSFQGTELVGVAAGESDNPGRNIPRAIKQIFWRILLFYVLAIFLIGCLIPYTSPSLLQNNVQDVGMSPFTLVFQNAGLAFAASVMNAVILTAILSAGNSGMYASTRMLYNMALSGMAPKVFGKLTPNGVPRNALYATTVVAGLCFFSSMFGNQTVYLWLLNISGMSGFIAWLGISICHYRFRKGFLAQGHSLDELPYKAKWFPFGPIFAFALCLFVTLGQDYQAFSATHVDVQSLAATYIGIPLFVLVWLIYRIKNKSRLVRYEDMRFPGVRAVQPQSEQPHTADNNATK
ncbi:amino acid permease [Plesiomonas shigelloides]|uniref:amino acid permease n=1 Tax=Plesiomonas shigelloides TaxID=703 RepID=UPI00126286D6|nr:amino acid permease [Plesiomonas shigelloides]KAB7700173.1 amino acid permease [Plesiomonas shigelloides]